MNFNIDTESGIIDFIEYVKQKKYMDDSCNFDDIISSIKSKKLIIKYFIPLFRISNYPLHEELFGRIFGSPDVDITNRKHKKMYIKTTFRDVYDFLEQGMPYVYDHVQKSKLLQNMAVKISKSHGGEDDCIMFLLSGNATIRFIRSGKIRHTNALNNYYSWSFRSYESHVKSIKICFKLKTQDIEVYNLYQTRYGFNVKNPYIFLLRGYGTKYQLPLLLPLLISFDLFVLHRRNKVKISIQKISTEIYSIITMLANYFISKNLFRLSLYY